LSRASEKKFGQKQKQKSTIQPNHKSLFIFTKLVKNKSRGVPALKVDGVTLLTGPEKAEASKFSAAHNNTMSSPLQGIVEDECSVLDNNEFNLEASILTSPREINKIIKNLKNSKASGFKITFQIFFFKISLIKLLFS
jgi:hypothetical protein